MPIELIYSSGPFFEEEIFEIVISGHESGNEYNIIVEGPSKSLKWEWTQNSGRFDWPRIDSSGNNTQDLIGTQIPIATFKSNYGAYAPAGSYQVTVQLIDKKARNKASKIIETIVSDFQIQIQLPPTNVQPPAQANAAIDAMQNINSTLEKAGSTRLLPPGHEVTENLALWGVIKGSVIEFDKLEKKLLEVMCNEQINDHENDHDKIPEKITSKRQSLKDINLAKNLSNNKDRTNKDIYWDANSYETLKNQTDIFLLEEVGSEWDVKKIAEVIQKKLKKYIDHPSVISESKIQEWIENYKCENLDCYVFPYLCDIKEVKDMPEPDESNCKGVLQQRMCHPLLVELIWCYWHEESMLSQAMKAINLRFQNKRMKKGPDALSALNTNPLRKLSNLLWGHIQEEQKRLTVKRRAYEYDHHYGITLHGDAVGTFMPADSRTRFLESFHRLLHLCTNFYKEFDDMTIQADGFPIKSALREVHMNLAEGAHNQYGDMPWIAKREMLIEQFILSRPEMREFLGGRVMVPYKEGWMEAVDTMKRLQGWTDTSVEQFASLGRLGEQIILSIRYGNWNAEGINADHAYQWAAFWRDEIQDYIHSYRSVSGVDLTEPSQVDGTQPSVHLKTRLDAQQKKVAG